MSNVQVVLPEVLKDLSETQLLQTLRFALFTLGCDQTMRAENLLKAASDPLLSHLLQIATQLGTPALTELIFRAEDQLRGSQMALPGAAAAGASWPEKTSGS